MTWSVVVQALPVVSAVALRGAQVTAQPGISVSVPQQGIRGADGPEGPPGDGVVPDIIDGGNF